MKNFFALLFITVLFSSCDDGDLTQVSFDFDTSDAQACATGTSDFFIYKIQDQRALIIQLPEKSFENKITADQPTAPLTLAISSAEVRLLYREYSGTVTSNTMCSTVPVSSPTVTQEREATDGTITITTTALKSAADANGATQITGYLHTLTFTNLVFELGDEGTQINEAFTQVTYQTDAEAFTPFSGLTGLKSCANDNSFLFKYLDKQALILDLNDADASFLFSGAAGPKVRLISADNKLTRVIFNATSSSLTDAYFCTIPTPTTPAIAELFTAENGIADQSGIIEVTSLPSTNGFKHTIVLKNIRLAKGSLKVDMGAEYIFGEFETMN